MLPSKTELNLAKKAKFDLYTITNFSFMELALHLGLKPNLFAVTKNDLANRDEDVQGFNNVEIFTHSEPFVIPVKSENKTRSLELKYDAEFDVNVIYL